MYTDEAHTKETRTVKCVLWYVTLTHAEQLEVQVYYWFPYLVALSTRYLQHAVVVNAQDSSVRPPLYVSDLPIFPMLSTFVSCYTQFG
jgi:hypothetical protein